MAAVSGSELPIVEWGVSPYLTGDLRWFTAIFVFEQLVGFWLLVREVRRGGGDPQEAGDLGVYVWLGAVVGARLGHELFYESSFGVARLFELWRGGLSSHGAAAGILAAAWLFSRRHAVPLTELTDRLVLSVAFAASTHRIASLLNGDSLGAVTDQSWGLRFLSDLDPDRPLRHPTQLYEALLGWCLLATLGWLGRRKQRPRGLLTGLLLIGYFGGRALIESWKEGFDAAENVTAQLLCLPFGAAGLWVLWRSLARKIGGWPIPHTDADTA
jgi:phosphatidylglycerol---prolipoprotein diacylglyceryl transferase